MSSLLDIQRAMRTAILSGDPDACRARIAEDSIDAVDRIDVYRNNVMSSLAAALAEMFPVVRRLVGEDFFAFAAHEFICDHPPDDPRVVEYGDAFADFLADFPPCGDLVYLADVARLERILQQSAVVAESPAIAPSNLEGLDGEDPSRIAFRLRESFGYLCSPYPISCIWRANQADADGEDRIDLDEGGVSLEIRRNDGLVVFRELSPAVFTFRAALARGVDLVRACEAASNCVEPFDPEAEFIALFNDGALAGVEIDRSNEP